jgi:two-component system catabolic regulation response regulator CreB
MRILVVEDDPGISDVLEFSLKAEGHDVVVVQRGVDAVARGSWPDCILLDIGLPDIDGFEVCRRIRRTSGVPVIFLTARSDEIDRIVGLELGADDYVAKPFSTRELIARIRAVTRRAQTKPVSDDASGLSISEENREVRFHGKKIELSKLEFDLLALLSGGPGRVFTREQILDLAWPDGGCVIDRTVDVHVKSLRRKLGDPEAIETVRGVGYRFRNG